MVAYAILCISATGRSIYQIASKFSEAPLAYSVSAVSALVYGLIAFALWRGMQRVALVGTICELVGVLVVGVLGVVAPELWPDETVWTGFGSAYGWVPLALPLVALWFIARPVRA